MARGSVREGTNSFAGRRQQCIEDDAAAGGEAKRSALAHWHPEVCSG